MLVGLEIGRGNWAGAWPTLVAVVTYVLGSGLTPFVIRSGDGVHGAPRRLLAWATVLLAIDAVIVLVGFGPGSETPTGFLRYLGIVAATLAMAMQTPAVRTVGGVAVSSTFSSGMLVRLGQSLGDLTHRATRAREMPVTRILGVINAAFLGGAILGGVLIEAWGNPAILVPTLALPAIAVLRSRADPSP